jgi:UDP-2,3-diacylglucosamine hydrolase
MKLRRWLRNPISLFILRNLPLSTSAKTGATSCAMKAAQTRMKASRDR